MRRPPHFTHMYTFLPFCTLFGNIESLDTTATVGPLSLRHALGKPETAVHDRLIEHQGGVWFACRMGLLHLPPGWRRFASPNPGPEDGSPSSCELIRSLAASRAGTIWAHASRPGLTRPDPATAPFFSAPSWAVNSANTLFYCIHLIGRARVRARWFQTVDILVGTAV